MFKRIKVITLLISVLLVLGIMQVISAGIFINALNNDKDNFTVSQLSSKNVAGGLMRSAVCMNTPYSG